MTPQLPPSIAVFKANYLAQSHFKHIINKTVDKHKIAHLNLESEKIQIALYTAPQTAVEAREGLGDMRFSIVSFIETNNRMEPILLNVFTEPSIEITNTLLGNWETLEDLNLFQTQNLSQASQTFFKLLLTQLTIDSECFRNFSSLTVIGGDINYDQVQSTIQERVVLTAIIPYTSPSVGHGSFLITTQLASPSPLL